MALDPVRAARVDRIIAVLRHAGAALSSEDEQELRVSISHRLTCYADWWSDRTIEDNGHTSVAGIRIAATDKVRLTFQAMVDADERVATHRLEIYRRAEHAAWTIQQILQEPSS